MTELGALQVESASLTERGLYLKQKASALVSEIDKNKKMLALNEKTKVNLEAMKLWVVPVEQVYAQLSRATDYWLDNLKKQDEKAAQISKDIRDRLHSARNNIEILREKLDLIQNKKRDIQVKQARMETLVRESADYLVNELKIPLETALKADDESRSIGELRRLVNNLKSQLKSLGLVNPGALDEYKRLDERRIFLDKQIKDLRASRSALEKVISAIERKITERFLRTFAKVNENFKKVFGRLFPGGEVQLILTAADDAGEAGIEIEAQPRGKTLQSLNLLSGGEKSLVGLALLFAFFYTRPSPFYILDEVEAALDDINIQRFIGLINELKYSAQFLIITHQRRTMEIADSLYGVSMQADGVSKLVSQKLDEGDNATEEKVKVVKTVEVGS
ncbi:MAG TPA: hypothetical protein ENH19_02575 [Actinobacteria bacterium]|nr:hypothetical protein [Actinomycetes bacterium]HEX21522.1 hypothetical protein [Actinomycetota bacterium]